MSIRRNTERFTKEDDEKIKQLREEGVTIIALTERYGCCIGSIHKSLIRAGFFINRKGKL